MHDSKKVMVRLAVCVRREGEGGFRYWQLSREGGGLCQLPLITCDVSMLDHCQKTHNIHTAKTRAHKHTIASTPYPNDTEL